MHSTHMEHQNDNYDSPWKEAIERYFPEFMRTLMNKGSSVILLQIRRKNEKIDIFQG